MYIVYMMKAVQKKTILIVGGSLGARTLNMSVLANLQLMGGMSRQGAALVMVCPAFDVHTVTDGTLALPPRPQGTLVSVFCHGAQAEGVTLRGLQYPLEGALLTCDHPLGVSNAYTKAQAASVTVARGTLLVYVALDA